MLENEKIDIFKDHDRDIVGEQVSKAVDELTNNGEDKAGLFESVSDFEKSLLDTFGGKVVSSEPLKGSDILKTLLDAPEPEKALETPPSAPQEPSNEILNEALSWIEDGKSVIPVGRDKKPLINWKEYHSRIATEEEVLEWWKKWPDAQLGLVTGKISGLAVVDVEKEFGDYRQLNLPDTDVSKTGSGGYHLFYSYVDGVRNKAKIGGKEIDVRGEGGYVILPPSSNEKGRYEWIKRTGGVLPGFPVNIFPTEKPVEEHKGLEYKVTDYPGYGSGQRNNEMTRYVGAVLSKMSSEFWDELAWPMIKAANQRNSPPLDESELLTTYKSIKGVEGPQSFEKWQVNILEKQKQDRLNLLDAIEGDDVIPLEEAAEAIRALNPQTYPTGLAVFDNAMRGGFKEGDLVIVTGMSGHGKTTLGQTFSFNLLNKELPLLWFSYEVSADILDEKFTAMGVKKGYKIYVPRVTATGDMIWVENKISESINKYQVRCVFVDLIDFLSPKNQKHSDSEALALKRITSELKNIAREKRIVMFVMAHVRKQKDTKKGLELQDIAHSSGIVQLADYVFAIERTPNKAEKTKERFFDTSTGQELEARKHVEYGQFSKIRIMKNRYTGMLVQEDCILGPDQRFHPEAPSRLDPVKLPDYFNK